MSSSLAKVLIVDDKIENLIAMEHTLKPVRVEVVKAQSGEAALSQLLHNEFALVLLDVQMPDMDGFETATLMQECNPGRNVPVLFLTAAHRSPDYATKGYRAGAVDYLTKPVDPEILRSKVRVFVDLHEQATALRRLGDELRRRSSEAERSRAELEELLFVASHHLQEPARKISMVSSIIARKHDGGSENILGEHLDRIVAEARRVRTIVNDLMAFWRVRTADLSFLQSDVAELLYHAMRSIKRRIDDAGAIITHDPLPNALCDTSRVTVVFRSLLSNSLKFKGDKKPRIHVSVSEEENHWVFGFSDNGIGIDPAYANSIFVMGKRLHSEEAYPGTGTGLAICKHIIEEHNGRMWITSGAGEGTVVHFTLPKSPAGLEKAPTPIENAS